MKQELLYVHGSNWLVSQLSCATSFFQNVEFWPNDWESQLMSVPSDELNRVQDEYETNYYKSYW